MNVHQLHPKGPGPHPGDLLDAALTYASRGWRVFPCVPRDKLPLLKRWQEIASVDEAQIRRWWAKWPTANVGIATGDASGFWVLDVDEADGKEGGETLREHERQHGALPDTVEQNTPSGGRHLLFRMGDVPVRNSAQKRLGRGLDTRGTGGFIMAPPSVHPNGGTYEWSVDGHPAEMQPAEAPPWLYELLKDKPVPEAPAGPARPISDAYARAAIEGELGRVLSAAQGERNDTLNKAAFALGQFVGAGALDRDEAVHRLTRAAGAIGLGMQESSKTIDSGLTAGATKPREMPRQKEARAEFGTGALGQAFSAAGADHTVDPATGEVREKPTITLLPGQLHLTASAAEHALILADAPLFVRGGRLFRPVIDEVDAARGQRTKVARLTEVTPDGLIDWLSRVAHWEKPDGRRKSDAAVVNPPRNVAMTMLSRDGEWRLRPLAGVITTPTLRPDGSLLMDEGYDPATRLLLVQPPPMPPVAEQPSRDQALQALALLDGLLGEFPFLDPASRSVALSALITPVVRGGISAAPLHAGRATTPGSGKSYLFDVASAIATGQRCPVLTAGKTEEETEKRLGSALLAGQPIISIDNFNGELGGDLICQMVERPLVQVRRLGHSELSRIENRATMFATGNNLVLVGDMVRRVVLCSLDANVERPELREFAGDPFGTILKDRGRYVAAALTVVRAYIGAGFPASCSPLASFEDWSLLVRSALVWLDRADPVDTMEAARNEDPELIAINEVVSAWKQHIGIGIPVSTGELVVKAVETEAVGGGNYNDTTTFRLKHPELNEALVKIAGKGREISSPRLGQWLGRRKGRVVDGMRILAHVDRHAKKPLWVLAK